MSTAVTLAESQCSSLARELHEAERKRLQVEHFSKRFPGMTIDDSYAIQRDFLAETYRVSTGKKRERGH